VVNRGGAVGDGYRQLLDIRAVLDGERIAPAGTDSESGVLPLAVPFNRTSAPAGSDSMRRLPPAAAAGACHRSFQYTPAVMSAIATTPRETPAMRRRRSRRSITIREALPWDLLGRQLTPRRTPTWRLAFPYQRDERHQRDWTHVSRMQRLSWFSVLKDAQPRTVSGVRAKVRFYVEARSLCITLISSPIG
jgi:hypothetical protein